MNSSTQELGRSMIKPSTVWTIFWALLSFSCKVWTSTTGTETVLFINYQAHHLFSAGDWVPPLSSLSQLISLFPGAQHKQQRISSSGQAGFSFTAGAEVLPGCRMTQTQEKSKAVSLKLCRILNSPAAERCQPCSFLLSGSSSQPTFILSLCLLSLLLRELAQYITHISPHQTHQFFSNFYKAVYLVFVSSWATSRPLKSCKNLSCSLVSSVQLSLFPGIESSCFLLPRRFLQAHSCQ